MQTIRIFISSPGDVAKERQRAGEVIDSLRRRYAHRFYLQPVFWEDLPLQPDMSFQQGIDVVISEQGVDIAVFILWSRLGSPIGSAIPKPDGSEYRSGTEREYDLMMRARARTREAEGKPRPAILVYTRCDETSFEEQLRGKPTAEKKSIINQKGLLESFLHETFKDQETGANIGAYFPFDRPVTFSRRLRVHLQELLDPMAGEMDQVIWDTDKQGPPFLGLETFQPEHSTVFFGREEEILEARNALKDQALNGCAFLLLSGASGSGKSSIARAGLLPAVVENEIDDQVAAWSTLILTPADLVPDPIAALVARLAADSHFPALSGDTAEIAAGLKENPELTFRLRIKDAIRKGSEAADGPVRLLLIFDQLEEWFTSASPITIEQRKAFLDVVETFARSGSVWVIATVRSDFYQQIQSEPALVRMKSGRGQLDLMPPGPAALTRMIEEPALLAGLSFETLNDKSLSDRILKDAASHAELLPLVEFVLRELYDRQSEKRQLTFAAYEDLGGVEGALAKRAEETYAALSPDVQLALGGVLQDLITVGQPSTGNGDDVDKLFRQHAPLSIFSATPEAMLLLERFVEARLFTTGHSESTREPTVTVAHESLLRVWPRAKAWADDNRDFLRTRARIAARMSEGSPLLAGDPLLASAKNFFLTKRDGFSHDQQAWVEQAINAVEKKEKRAILRRQLVIASLSLLTVISMIAAFAAYRSYRMARRESEKSERSLQLIGDAHENSSRLIADLLVDLRSKLDPRGDAAALDDAQRMVNENLEANRLPGDDPDSLHMRSVILNSRGYLARRTGDFKAAGEYYSESLGIRKKLLADYPEKTLYQHNLALSHDNMGDLHVAIAVANRADKEQSQAEFGKAAEAYRQSLELTRQLVARPDATSQWRHDLAVGYFKAGDALLENDVTDQRAEALKILESGFRIAEEVAASDPEYVKWQAHLALYCLELGRVHALAAEDEKARVYLEKGHRIFTELRRNGRMTRQYDDWLKQIEQSLAEIG